MTADDAATDEGKLWRAIVARVTASIRSGEYPAGTKLPSIRAMAKELGCAPGTIEKVYKELDALGLVDSEDRSGFRVTPVAGVVPDEPLHVRVKRLEEWQAEVQEWRAGLDTRQAD